MVDESCGSTFGPTKIFGFSFADLAVRSEAHVVRAIVFWLPVCSGRVQILPTRPAALQSRPNELWTALPEGVRSSLACHEEDNSP